MSRNFIKMNGLGNDFVIVETKSQAFDPSATEAQAIASRDGGIGCDQIISIDPPDRPGVHATMRIWNADGGEVEACGNAARCVGWLLMESGGRDHAEIATKAGVISASRAGDKLVAVDMGEPRLSWDQIPLSEEMDTRNIELQVGPIDNPHLHTPGAVSMGNPHVVFFVDSEPTDELVRGSGSLVEHHPLFPEGVNVGFAYVKARDRIRLRVWERGAGLTLACGTGACAALVACARRGLTDRKATLELDGGDLTIEWRETDGHVMMTGPVALEYSGTL